jgi:enamine deaminase RidA (YjgF/YER057c/UK114 family)
VGRLRCDPLPDAAGARRAVRPAVARDGGGNDAARTAPQLVEIAGVGHAPTFVQRTRSRSRADFYRLNSLTLKETMQIQRLHVGKRLSEIAIHNGTVYLAGQIAEDTTQDIAGQTREVLGHVDRLLNEAGSDKTRILSVPDLHRRHGRISPA